MSKEKDPAFLFYSKDWLEGTADMSKEAKGVFIDLLAHQHQKNGLPNDIKKLARLASMSETEFFIVWEAEVKEKFQPTDDRLYNRKLTKVLTDRSDRGHRNKITGTLAAIFRLSHAPYDWKIKAKQGFKIDDFLTIPDQNLTDRLTEWFQLRLKSIENANANGNANTNQDRGVGKGVAVNMTREYKTQFPEYPIDPANDFPACVDIANKIADLKGWPRESVTNGHMVDVQAEWVKLVAFAKVDSWYSKKSISFINKDFQSFIQAKNGTTQSPKSGTTAPRVENVTGGDSRNF